MSLELATHPDDLMIVCEEVEEYPGKFATDFYRGKGHRYKPILTCDKEEAFAASKEAAIDRIRRVLESVSFLALYHGSAPKNSDEFISYIRKAGYTEEQASNERIIDEYHQYAEKGINAFLTEMIDIERVMNAAMIDEIIERIQNEGYCDTSEKPLISFTGEPTY